MRVAIVSDIHGNRRAFEAVLADLSRTSPDLVLHGGDLAHGGASAVEIVDWVRDLGWRGVRGNVDEMMARPESLEMFANQSSAPKSLWAAIREMAEAARSLLGAERIAWLGELPLIHYDSPLALVHASRDDTWRSPGHEASDIELEETYKELAQPMVVYAHIHHPFIRTIHGMTVCNTGSVGLSYDGDHRAAYLLLDDGKPTIRRVEYDVEAEIDALSRCGLPHGDWIAKMLRSGRPQLP
jgi:predicted phosphodiesterase